jgi:phosphohistidine phosphatase SixA
MNIILSRRIVKISGVYSWKYLKSMKATITDSTITVLIALSLVGCTCRIDSVPAVSGENPLVVFLVRHGEKVDTSDDAALSAAGRQRAADLDRTLRSAEIEYVHSSDFTRCRETAEPTASMLGLEVEPYDPLDLPALAIELRKTGGRHLVVGHSNTTPQLVRVLCGTSDPVTEAESQYGRLYIVTVWSDGRAGSAVIHFGADVVPEEG